MEQHVSSRRRVAGGLTCVAAGAAALVLGLAGPVGATGGPEVERGDGWSIDELSDRYGGNWAEVEVPMESGRYLLDDRGTPDRADDAYADVTVEGGTVDWSSDDLDIDVVQVEGDEESHVYTNGGGHERRGGHDLDRPDHGGRDRDRGGHGRGIKFCWNKGGGHGSTTTTEHETTTTEAPHPPTTVPPSTTTVPEETTSTEAPTTTESTVPPETTVPPTTLPETGSELPRTGSTTAPLLAGAGALLAVGVAAFLGRRYLQQRA